MKWACAILSSCVLPRTTAFFYIIWKRHDFRKKKIKLLNMKCAFQFSLQHHCNSNRNWVRCDLKCILVFMWSIRYYCEILTKLEFSCQIFEKHSNIIIIIIIIMFMNGRACFLFLNPQDKVDPSISFSVVLCSSSFWLIRFFLLRILWVFWSLLDRLPARRRVRLGAATLMPLDLHAFL